MLAVACSSSVPPATQGEVRNTCKTNGDCSIYEQGTPLTCTRGQCVSSGNFLSVARLSSTPYPYTLVISTPATAGYLPGTAVVVGASSLTLFPDTGSACSGDATTSTCVRLPKTGSSSGVYDVDPSTAEKVKRYVGDGETVLPVHTTYTLLTNDTSMTTRESTGIPVFPTYATISSTSYNPSQPPGPGGSNTISFAASMAPGRYRRDIQVDPPFDDAFPPWSDVVKVDDQNSFFLPVKVGASSDYVNALYIQNATSVFDSPIGHFVCAGNDCAGWTASLVDVATGRRTSNVFTFTDPAGGAFSLFTVFPPQNGSTTQDQTGQALVLAPPPGQAFPSIFSEAVGGTIPGQQSYPAVQIAAVVQGNVNAQRSADPNDLAPVKARLDFASVDQAFKDLYANTPLVYRTSVVTDASGNYTVQLPRGTYDVAVTPEALGTPYSILYKQIVVAATPAGTTLNFTQSGPAFHFVVQPPTTLTGHVRTVDGRPLAGIAVAASRATGVGTTSIPAKLSDLARAQTTTTDADGAYTLGLDPGTYDVFAAPAASTGFAWAVAPGGAVVVPNGA
ncbi:MAG TPA: carboxypeptidase-like regulatory domain-containing protein, partial [Polyangiaceae bacterium]